MGSPSSRVTPSFISRRPAPNQSAGIGAGRDANTSLQDARSAVEFLGHEVHGAAVVRVAGFEDALVGVEARVQRQQRRVDIENPACIVLHEPGAQDAHEAREYE